MRRLGVEWREFMNETRPRTGPLPGSRIYRDVTLDRFQEQAIDAIDKNHSVLVCAPTGAGKTLIAEYALEKCIREGRRLVYTAPIKALNNQKYRDFSSAYPGKIGIQTGDVTQNPDAPILLMTTEIFRNKIFESPRELEGVDLAVLDEIHYLDDIERGTVWEECILFAPSNIRLICLSATVPNFLKIGEWLRRVRPETPLEIIWENTRPVPLEHRVVVPRFGVRTLAELEEMERRNQAPKVPRRFDDAEMRSLLRHLREAERLPAIVFCFHRRGCERWARATSEGFLSQSEREAILSAYDRLCDQFDISEAESAAEIRELLPLGICYHHAGLLPTLKEVIERLFATGMLKVLFATETFALGVNMPARSVVFSSLFKFDGRRVQLLRRREHHQMAGRAGRRGMDTVGYVYSVADWPAVTAEDLRNLLFGELEAIRSQFNLSYSTLLILYEHLRERIFRAMERSLSRHLEGGRDFRRRMARLESKLRVLRNLGYLRNGEPTEKGRFAARISAYELPVTELYFSGWLGTLSEEELCQVFVAATYEARRGCRYRMLEDPRFRRLRRDCERLLRPVLREEEQADLAGETRAFDFRLSGAVHAWVRGVEFEDLERFTSVDPGDLVRTFRMAIQVIRNLSQVAKDSSLRGRLLRCLRRMNRGEVDAERQLRLGSAWIP